MELKGNRIGIKDLQIKDVYEMRKWGLHDNPLLEDYNFPPMNNKEIVIWYNIKAGKSSNRYFAIRNEKDKLIGYMGIKGIRRILRESTLGIVLDPNYINRGYGSEILSVFLTYYFTTMKMRKMILEVAEFNKRAYRLYEKMGFKRQGYYLDEFFDPHLDLNNPYYLNEKSSFVISEEKIYNYIYKMVLDKKDFIQLANNTDKEYGS